MSDNKKYYYLKLKENFFQQEHMIVIEALPNGYIYSNILLKMYLRSLKFDGKLMITKKIPYDPEKPEILARVLNHDVAHLKETLRLAQELEIVKILKSGEMFMMDIQHFIGKSSNEADRIRSYRKRIKAKEKKSKKLCTNVTTNAITKIPDSLYKCTPEIEIEIEKERESNSSFFPVIKKEVDAIGPKGGRSGRRHQQSHDFQAKDSGYAYQESHYRRIIETMTCEHYPKSYYIDKQIPESLLCEILGSMSRYTQQQIESAIKRWGQLIKDSGVNQITDYTPETFLTTGLKYFVKAEHDDD